jgi:hypothetical protein
MRPSRRNTGNLCSKTLAPTRPQPRSGGDVFRKFSVTSCASPAAAASGPWKSRPPMQFDCTAATRFGRTWRSGCSTTPASSAPAGMKKTGVGRHSRRCSPLRIADPISLRLDVRMVPKYHPTPLSGGGAHMRRNGVAFHQAPMRPVCRTAYPSPVSPSPRH